MALIVHKYGGTSMGSAERIRNVAKRVAKWVRAGHQLVVVPSAMSGETNRLLGLAKEVSPEKASAETMRELDMIAATGEQVSVGLLSLALQAEGTASGQLRRLAGADQDRQRVHQGAHREHRRRACARRPRGRQGGDHHRLPGHRRRRPHHHARAAAAPTPGGGGGGGDEGRRVPDLHRRRRRLHHRPAHRARGAAAAPSSASKRCSRWRAWAARCCRSVRWSSPASTACRCACCRASRRGTSRWPKRRVGHADHIRGRRENGTSRCFGHRLQPRRSQGHDHARARQARHRLPDPRCGGRGQHRRRRDRAEREPRRQDRLLVHRAPQRLRAHDGPAEEQGRPGARRQRGGGRRARSARCRSSASA